MLLAVPDHDGWMSTARLWSHAIMPDCHLLAVRHFCDAWKLALTSGNQVEGRHLVSSTRHGMDASGQQWLHEYVGASIIEGACLACNAGLHSEK